MATLVSSWSSNAQTLPEKYVFPPGERPGDFAIATCNNNPIIDLSKTSNHNRAKTIQQILTASQEFGFFQVINHGVPTSLMAETLDLVKEFFDLPEETKKSVFSADSSKNCRLYTSSFSYATEEVHYWRDNLTHPCHPIEDCMQLWPHKPTRYRNVVGANSVEVRNLVLRILDLICEGLGLEEGYLGGELSKNQLQSVNHYPKCPDPSLALGMHRHCDPNLITVLDQGGLYGLQVFKDGQWIGVEPIPNAFVVLIGCQLQIISNGKMKSGEHRVVTNSENARTSVGYFFIPSNECKIGPAKSLLSATNPPLYRTFHYEDFLSTFAQHSGNFDAIIKCYKLHF